MLRIPQTSRRNEETADAHGDEKEDTETMYGVQSTSSAFMRPIGRAGVVIEMTLNVSEMCRVMVIGFRFEIYTVDKARNFGILQHSVLHD